jgi:hypothetical protein
MAFVQHSDVERHAAVDLSYEVGVAEAAQQLDVSTSSITNWRRRGYGSGAVMDNEGETGQLPALDDVPPGQEGGGSSSTKGSSKNKSSSGKKSGKTPTKQSIFGLISTIGTGVMLLNAYDGQRILENAESLADALHKAAKENPALRKALNAALQASTWGAVASAFAPIIVPILANHEMLPPETATLFGAPMPASNGAGQQQSMADLLGADGGPVDANG